jgi:predicted CXXCH cytochrome family protein
MLTVSIGLIGLACVQTPPDDGGGGGDEMKAFVGAGTCQQCHADSHETWAETAHAGALETLEAIGQGENAECLPCHVVGFGETDGFVDRATTDELAGVQCENCHGPGGEHARDPSDEAKRPTINFSSSNCGECHTDAHHPTFDEWEQSRHAGALATLKGNDHANDSCLVCHSQDFRYAMEQGTETPTLDSAEFAIECSTCHSPHGGTEQVAQLRQPIGMLCGECHTQGEDTLPGDTPHHPQLEMLKGEGARTDAGDPLVQAGPHSGLVDGDACARCHVVMIEVEDPNEGSPNATGHTFNPFDDSITAFQPSEKFAGCNPCHDAAGAQQRIDAVQPEVETRLALLAPFFDSASATFISTNGLSDDQKSLLAVAKFNYQYVDADGSRGVHNPTNASAALEVAEKIVDDLMP